MQASPQKNEIVNISSVSMGNRVDMLCSTSYIFHHKHQKMAKKNRTSSSVLYISKLIVSPIRTRVQFR